MTEYVIGISTDNTGRFIVVRKSKPAWQRGKINFPGGKIEPGEMPDQAMVREYYEEVGVKVPAWDWRHFLTMKEEGVFAVHCFVADSDVTLPIGWLSRENDEPVELHTIDEILNAVATGTAVENLAWITYLALDDNPRLKCATVEYANA